METLKNLLKKAYRREDIYKNLTSSNLSIQIIKILDLINIKLVEKEDRINLQDELELEGIEIRICSNCGKLMANGFVIEGGDYYYCTEECMINDRLSKEEFERLYDNGNGDSYYTEWY